MSERWRDKKDEPGFAFQAWMRTVDDLEDQIADLVTPLREAHEALGYVLGCDIGDPARHKANSAFTRIEMALAKAEAQS